MRKLAERLNTTGSTINKLEKGHSGLDLKWIERLAKAFDVLPEDIISNRDSDDMSGFSEDAVPFGDSQDEIRLTDTQYLYEARTNVLDQLGILPGTMLVVDIGSEQAARLASEDIVIAQVYDDAGGAVTIMRQFIFPSLLISNSSERNERTINIRTESVAIKGIVVSRHARMRKRGPGD